MSPQALREWEYLDEVSRKIIANLIAEPRGLHFSEIVRRIKKPKETVNRRLKYLVFLGIIEKVRVGNKVIYRLSNERRKAVEEAMMYSVIPNLLISEIGKLFLDALREGLINEAIAALCKTMNSLTGVLTGNFVALTDTLYEEALRLRNEGIPRHELERVLINYAFLYARPMNYLSIIVTLATSVVIEMVEKEIKLELNRDDVIKTCRDDVKSDKLFESLLNRFQDKEYVKRIMKVLKCEGDSWLCAIDAYKDIAREYIEKYIKVYPAWKRSRDVFTL